MVRYILLLVFLGLFTVVQAQNDWCNPLQRPMGVAEGGFRIVGGIAAGCAPFTVVVEKTISENPSYIYNYRGGNPIDPTVGYMLESRTTATYLAQGSYRILQLASFGSGSAACQTVEVFERPNFTAKSCSGRRVQVVITNDSIAQRYEAFSVDWGMGGAPTRVAKSPNMTVSFTYPDVSPRIITVTGIYAGNAIRCQQAASNPVTPSNVSLSAVRIRRVTTRTDGLADVLVEGVMGIVAELQISTSGSGAFMATGQTVNRNDTTTLTVRSIDALKNTYCFRLSANDGCDNTGSSVSNEVCSTNLTATAQNRENLLEWPQYPATPAFITYSFKRNSITTKGVNNRAIGTDIDANVICGEQYCYQMTVVLNDRSESVSPLRCVKAISNEIPSLVRNPYVNVLEESQKIEVRADEPATGNTPTNFKTIILRSTNGGDFGEVAALQNTIAFTDETAQPDQQSYCYKIQYENTCGNRSEPTEPFCSIRLYSKSGKSIEWTADSPYTIAVGRYVIDKLDEQGNLFDQIEVGSNTSFSLAVNDFDTTTQLFRYRIVSFSSNAPPSYSNFFVFKRNARMSVPSAFSPNEDRINDTFFPIGFLVNTFQMVIYNRWGEALYQTNDIKKGWNGTFNEQPVADGTYTYRITFTDSLEQQFVKLGTVVLVRKPF